MIYRFQRFVWCRLACTNRFWPTFTDRLWPDRLSHSLFGQLVWQMARAGEGRGGRGGDGREGGREGAGGAEVMAWGVQWGRSQWGRSVPVWSGPWWWPTFHMFPILFGFFVELCWCSGRFHMKRPQSGRGVTRCPESPDVYFLPVRGSVLPEV